MLKPLTAYLIWSLFFIPLCASLSMASDQQTDQKEWTFLTFLNGNNNLDSFGKLNMNQMEQVGSTADINVVVQWASLAAKRTQRYYITKDANQNQVTSPPIADLKNVDMGDYKNLIDFIAWGVKNFPAKHYFINVWNHGSGWHLLKAMQAENARGLGGMGSELRLMDISWDDNTGNSISTEELGLAMTEAAKIIGHKVDIYGSDACLMAMAEIADEMTSSVSVYAGSEETEPGAGWPYNLVLSRWAAHPKSTAAEVATILTEEYIQSYSGGQNGIDNATFSALDLEQFPTLKASISKLGASILNLNSDDQTSVSGQIENAQGYTYSDYIDLGDFVSKIQEVGGSGLQRDTLGDVHAAIKKVVIANGATPRLARSTGIAIWIPGSNYNYQQYVDRYQKLKFDRDTRWSAALKAIIPQQ